MHIMEKTNRIYAAIDLKSFYASVECNERGLDPLATNLVVADKSRTEKTICLAISPSLKSYGLASRARLFEVVEKVKQINYERQKVAPLGIFLGKSTNNEKLKANPSLALDYIIAPPRMQYYLDYSSKIYNIYLRHVAPEDIFAYSIDEVFCDITSYLKISQLTPEEFVTNIISEILQETGITATAGIGTNLFLAKVAMDILAKHTKPNSAGVRIASLDEQSFRKQLWAHQPLTDFWRIGRGYAKRLHAHNLYTMGDIARYSINNEELLYRLFGVNAELLIDHSWGWEPTRISNIKTHRPLTQSLSSGQVLSCPYPYQKAKIIVKEMAEALSLDLVAKQLVTDHLVLHIVYDKSNSSKELVTDLYGRRTPKPAHGTLRLDLQTSSSRKIISGFTQLFERHINPHWTIRRVYLSVNNLIPENTITDPTSNLLEQTDFFTNYAELEQQKQRELNALQNEHKAQTAILKIRERYGKNAILRGTNFEDGATMTQRHHQIGGHRA